MFQNRMPSDCFPACYALAVAARKYRQPQTPAHRESGHLSRGQQHSRAVVTRRSRVSASTIDRMLSGARAAAGGRRSRAKTTPAVRRCVPVRTFADWHDPAPGFVEADLVVHCGESMAGSFASTLVLTDIASG